MAAKKSSKRTTNKAAPAKSTNIVLQRGAAVFLRTVTYFYVGRFLGLKDGWIMLDHVSWVADTGRWSSLLKEGFSAVGESELYPGDGRADINLDTVVEVVPWDHELPTVTK